MKKLLALFALFLLLPATALAETECQSDADCPEGSYCAMDDVMGCACPPCDPDGGECPECECPEPEESVGYCEEFDLGFDEIVAGECASDADCPIEFICQEIQLPCMDAAPCACACETCPDDEPDCDAKCDECECPEPEPCEETTSSMCVFAPTECTADADCGAGFVCEAIEECYGYSSAGCGCTDCECAPCPEGEECPACECPDEPVCECDDEPESFEECVTLASICFPEEVPCETDADCAEDFTCFVIGASGGGTDCACPGCACAPCPDGEECEPCECEPCECEEEEDVYTEEKVCIPDGWDEAEYLGGGSVDMNDASETATGGDGNYEAPKSADPDGGLNQDAEESDDDSLGGKGESSDSTSETSGCTASERASSAPLFLVLALLLGLAIVRRTARDNA